MIVGRNRNVDFADVFQHELCSVPSSPIDEYGCIRQESKAELVNRFGITLSNPPSPDTCACTACSLVQEIRHLAYCTDGDMEWVCKLLTTSTQQSMHLEINATDYWERTYFQGAARSRIPMHGKGKVSVLRVLTRRT